MRRLLLTALMATSCGGDAPVDSLPPRPAVAPAAVAPGATAAAASAAATKSGASDVLADVRKRELSNEDFVENENNRDPFRSYLSSFAVQIQVVKQHKIILEKFSIDELKLIAIVAGEDTSPRAMFLDPGGMGITIARGDHVSKSDATVTRIAPDRVFFQIEEDAGQGKTHITERVIELHAGEAQTP